jgi:hypothetical protein
VGASGCWSSSRPRCRRCRGVGQARRHIPLSKDAKRSLECALAEAIWLGDKEILPWHLLLGIIGIEPSTVDKLVGKDGLHDSLRAAALPRCRAAALRRLTERAA